MKNNNIKQLIIILIILTGFLGIKTYLPRLFPKVSGYTKKLKSLDKTTINSIVILNSTFSLDLKFENNVWTINTKKADKTKVETLISQLFTSAVPELIAETDKRHKDFGLTTDQATSVKINNKLTWLIGKISGSSAYVRFDQENPVYLLKDLSTGFLSNVFDLYDKTILKFDQSKATKISIKNNNSTVTILKKDEKWISDVGNKEAKKEKVDAVLSQISNLTANSIYVETKTNNYSKTPTIILNIEYDGTNNSLEFYKGSLDYLVKRLSDKEQFIINESSISSIIPVPKEIFY